MKIKYKECNDYLPYRKIISYEYCCDEMREHQNSDLAYISVVLIENIVDKCPFCHTKIELEKVI